MTGSASIAHGSNVFYEHVNYFRMSDFRRMFDKVHVARRTFGEQYLSVVAELGSVRQPARDPSDPVAFPDEFFQVPEAPPGQAAAWGASSKGVLFTLMMERAGTPMEVVIDINPSKQRRFLPGSGTRVVSPADAFASLPKGATVYVMNSNYLPEIRRMSADRFRYVVADQALAQ